MTRAEELAQAAEAEAQARVFRDRDRSPVTERNKGRA